VADGKDAGDDEAVDSALSQWRQGDCALAEHWFAHRFAPEHPITPPARELAAAGVDLAESQVDGLVVLTQTCDIVRRCADRPYIEVAPLVEIDPGDRAMVGRRCERSGRSGSTPPPTGAPIWSR
jgi:hypothetical protein